MNYATQHPVHSLEMFLYACSYIIPEEDMAILKKLAPRLTGDGATHARMPYAGKGFHWKRARVGWGVSKGRKIAVFDVTEFAQKGNDQVARPIYVGPQRRAHYRSFKLSDPAKRSGLRNKVIYSLAKNPKRAKRKRK